MDYYNEFDEYPLQWLRNLQAAGQIPDGTFDGRSIVDVKVEDVKAARQAHFFAGIGGWPLALKLASWPEDQEVWTGSCPCQPFSVAGGRKGTKDKRHLWPDFFRLIRECLPPVVFGEQVASKDGRAWLSGVRDDLESVGYEVGAADLCAASAGEEGEGWILRGDQVFVERTVIGAPHIRQRLFWVANRERTGLEGLQEQHAREEREAIERGGVPDGVANRAEDGCGQELQDGRGKPEGSPPEGRAAGSSVRRTLGGMGNTSCAGSWRNGRAIPGAKEKGRSERKQVGGVINQPLATGVWSNFDVLPCSDKRARRVESGTFPLAHGVPGRVGKLRAYGNAIVSELAAEFIKAFLETCSPT